MPEPTSPGIMAITLAVWLAENTQVSIQLTSLGLVAINQPADRFIVQRHALVPPQIRHNLLQTQCLLESLHNPAPYFILSFRASR